MTQAQIEFFTGFISGLLSLAATTIVIAVAMYVEPSSNTRTNLVFCMMTAQWLRAFTVVSGSIIRMNQDYVDFSAGIGCSLNGFFITQSLVAGDVANLCIGLFTWLAFAQKIKFAKLYDFLDRHYTSTFVFPWLVASLIAVIAAFQPGYVPVKSNWCFINPVDNNLYRWLFAWAHRILISMLLFALYGHILFLVLQSRKVLQDSSAASQESSRRLNQAARKLFVYPLAYVIWGLPGILSRVVNSPTLNIIQAGSQSIGLVDALLYGYSEDLRRRLMDKLRPHTQYVKDLEQFKQ